MEEDIRQSLFSLPRNRKIGQKRMLNLLDEFGLRRVSVAEANRLSKQESFQRESFFEAKEQHPNQ